MPSRLIVRGAGLRGPRGAPGADAPGTLANITAPATGDRYTVVADDSSVLSLLPDGQTGRLLTPTTGSLLVTVTVVLLTANTTTGCSLVGAVARVGSDTIVDSVQVDTYSRAVNAKASAVTVQTLITVAPGVEVEIVPVLSTIGSDTTAYIGRQETDSLLADHYSPLIVRVDAA